MMKDAVKKISRLLARWLYYFFSWFFRVVPYKVVQGLTPGIQAFGYFCLRAMRKSAMETLTIALGKEKTPAELERICKECFYNAGQSVVEIGVFSTRPQMIVQKFRFEGKARQYVEDALKEGKGVLCVSAHLGNFALMLSYLAQSGYPTNAIIRPSRDAVLEVDFQAARSKLGVKTVHSYPRETCVRESIKCLRAKELLVVLMDQNTGSKSGTVVEFFGQKSGTPTGPIIFAMRTGSPILPIFTVRDAGDTHKIIALPHFYLEQKATDEETVQFNVQKITTIIEDQIRANPKEWGWMHRRWKSRPKE